ncbi:MAG: hypothetical protein QGH40_08540 [bacterium]|jgi:DUF1680 family protein|nr:hypothetical protein [bacterium]
MLYGLSQLVKRRPGLMNIPNKKEFLSLSEKNRQSITRRIEEYMFWCCVPLNAMWAGAQYGVYLAATGQAVYINRYMAVVFIGPVLAIMVMSTMFVIRLKQAVEAAARQEKIHGVKAVKE